MRRKFAELQRIEGERKITRETDHAFFYYLQYGLLLALKERGTLTAMQFHLAEDRLREQRCSRRDKTMETGTIS